MTDSYETWASVEIPPNFPCKVFMTALGAGRLAAVLVARRLYVKGKTQTELTGALAGFDATAARAADKWEQVRLLRNNRLADVDFTHTTDYPGGNRAAMATYRQALRDIPQTQTNPFNIVWPVRPT